MNQKRLFLISLLIALLWLAVLAAQSLPPSSAVAQAERRQPAAPANTPTSTATATATPTTTVTSTATPTGTITVESTATQTPTVEASPSPAPSEYLYLPVLNSAGFWKRLETGAVQTGALSMAICPTDNAVRYLGTVSGLFKWSTDEWVQVMKAEGGTDPIPGPVWEVLVTGQDCNDVYAAALENGLWRVTEDETERLDKDGDDIPPVGSVVIRDKLLFAGTDGGVYLYDLDDKAWWPPTDVKELITRQSMAGDRVYAAAWTFGVKYNDACGPSQCNDWKELPAPTDLAYVRDVLGSSPDEATVWALAASSAGVIYWQNNQWNVPKKPPQPNGDTFAVAQSSDGATIFAAVRGSGIWASDDKGETWYRLGEFNFLTRDLTVAGDTLYALTSNDGVWQWLLPSAQESSQETTP